MSLLATRAIVLHTFNYLETSRVLRLLTRDGGVQSVLARGARRSRKRFGSAVDLFAEGHAQLYVRPGRDMQTLAEFDVTRARPELALDLGRFAAASALAELLLRFASTAAHPELFDVAVAALDAVGAAVPAQVSGVALGAAWQVVAELGFAPALDNCAACHAPVDTDAPAAFSHPAGGTLCDACARLVPARRMLPPAARDALRGWLTGAGATLPDEAAARAHQRLLREFVQEHLTDGRPMRAMDAWERGRLGSP